MKKIVIVVVALMTLIFASPAAAQDNSRPQGWGLGLGTGTAISGISAKYQMGGTAFQGVLGCWGYACRGVGLSADYLINMPEIVDADVVRVAWNLGGGAAIGAGRLYRSSGWYNDGYRGRSNVIIHGQFVAGLELIFPDVPLDIVFEWRPALRVIPFARVHPLAGGAHIRFYFQ